MLLEGAALATGQVNLVLLFRAAMLTASHMHSGVFVTTTQQRLARATGNANMAMTPTRGVGGAGLVMCTPRNVRSGKLAATIAPEAFELLLARVTGSAALVTSCWLAKLAPKKTQPQSLAQSWVSLSTILLSAWPRAGQIPCIFLMSVAVLGCVRVHCWSIVTYTTMRLQSIWPY
jgi:hypothetical protein